MKTPKVIQNDVAKTTQPSKSFWEKKKKEKPLNIKIEQGN